MSIFLFDILLSFVFKRPETHALNWELSRAGSLYRFLVKIKQYRIKQEKRPKNEEIEYTMMNMKL